MSNEGLRNFERARALAEANAELRELRRVLSALGVEKGPDGWTMRDPANIRLNGKAISMLHATGRIPITLPAERGEQMNRNHSESPNSSTALKSDALSGVAPGELRELADTLEMNWAGSGRVANNRAAAILRALADAIEQSEGKK